VRVHESAGAVPAAESSPDAATPAPATGLDAFPAPTGAPAPAVSHDDLSSEAPAPHDDARPSTALVAVIAPPRTLRTAAETPLTSEAGPRQSYAVASTGVIDIVAPTPSGDRPESPSEKTPADQEVQR